MNYSRKKIALLMGALIIGQVITLQNMQGMDAFGGDNTQENANMAYDFWSNAVSGLYNNITNTVGPWYRNTRPIKTATEKAIQLATTPTGLAITGSGIGAYTMYSVLPWWISYPIFTTGALAGATYIPGLSHVASEIGNGIRDGANIDRTAIQNVANNAIAVGRTIVNPEAVKGIITSGYETSKAAIGTVKDDIFNAVKHEIRDDIRYALNIPHYQDVNFDTITNKLTDKVKDEIAEAKNGMKDEFSNNIRHALNIPNHQDVNFDTITDKLTDKFKDEIREAKNDMKDEFSNNLRHALNIPDNQAVNIDTITDKLTDKFKGEIAEAKDAIKDEIEHNYRRALNIPADQPVNFDTIAKKIVEDPARKIFNIDPEEEVTADVIMRNVAKNTVYRFGIPTAVLVAATPIAITAGYFGCKYAYHRLTTEPEPPIFIESSEKSRWQNLKDFVLRNTDEIPELAYSEELEKTFDLITRSSINAFHEIQDGKKNIFYEPVLMYGPPGTGKTAKAKQMIKQIYQATDGQMQWRITNGSMLLNAGQNGINKMFDWLKKQPAACLFIDEADTLFPDRDELEKHPERLEIVNHLLSLIGERSNKFMIIMTTNRLGAFDDAMARRIDNLIHIPLPNEQGRNRVLKLYRDNMLLNQQSSWIMQLAQKHCPQLFEKPTLIRKK